MPYVQFSDNSKTSIISVFGCAQDAEAYPNQETVDEADARYQAFINPSSALPVAKSDQLALLAAAFATASVVNVTDSNGVIWSGGMSSALSIYGAVQLAAVGGATSVNLFDADNLSHEVTIEQGTAIAAAIGMAYQTVFARYQGYKAAVAAATTVAEVQAITWS